MKNGTISKILIMFALVFSCMVLAISSSFDVQGPGPTMADTLNTFIQNFSVIALFVFLYSTVVLFMQWLSNPTFDLGFMIGLIVVGVVWVFTAHTLLRFARIEPTQAQSRERVNKQSGPIYKSGSIAATVAGVTTPQQAVERLRSVIVDKESVSISGYTKPYLLPADLYHESRYVVVTRTGLYWIFQNGDVWKMEEYHATTR